MSDQYLHAIYCDDIRLELGGKQSFMGVYSGELLLSQMPSVLPKLCVYVEMNLLSTVKVNDFKIECRLDGNILAQTEIPAGDISSMQKNIDAFKGDSEVIAMALSFVFSPLIINGPSKITTVAFVNGEEYKAGALSIREQTVDEKNRFRMPFEMSNFS